MVYKGDELNDLSCIFLLLFFTVSKSIFRVLSYCDHDLSL